MQLLLRYLDFHLLMFETKYWIWELPVMWPHSIYFQTPYFHQLSIERLKPKPR